MKYAVLDLEVSAESSYGRFCNPLDKTNTITSFAFRAQGRTFTRYAEEGIDRNVSLKLDKFDLLVGQNIKFDLLYLWENESLRAFIKRGGKIWDTMIAEYLLRGQQGTAHGGSGKGSLSLNALSVQYGGQLKDNRISDMYKAGLKSNQIPKDMLLEYNAADVVNTEIVYLAQYKKAKSLGMLPLMGRYMLHALACMEMEHNGMHVDLEIAKVSQSSLEIDLFHLKEHLLTVVEDTWPIEIDFNAASAQHWSAYFFGGTVKYDSTEDTGTTFKTGKKAGEIRYKNTETELQIVGPFLPPPEAIGKRAGVYSVSEDVITTLKRTHKHPVFDLLLEYRGVSKLLSTYYLNTDSKGNTKGVLTKVNEKGTLHSEFNLVRTETGRLASSNPNAQNFPAEILDMFTSRFGDDGSIIEIDFSQLEVIIQAYLTQCPQMIKDIKGGYDFHRLRLSYALGCSYDAVTDVADYQKKRKEIAKPISFQKAYGAMPQTVANRTGLDVNMIQKVFDKEDERYPEIKLFYEDVQREIQNSRQLVDAPIVIRDKAHTTTFTRFGENQATGKYRSWLGKLYTFQENAVKTKKGDIWRYWSMPDIQNYPVQGTAADLVAMQVGQVFEYLLDKPFCLLVNEVHDSIVLDCRLEYKDLIVRDVPRIMEAVDESFQKYFGISFNVPVKVDVKVGKSWRDCKEN
jgi:DNA polymerase I-like protein with 3'-5' exonuclease and polymerase domains